jgi:multiple sugar transport system ATP-binding protein
MAEITIDGLTKVFGDDDSGQAIVAVEDLDVTIEDGEFVVFVGPSGCGKTTTLRCVAGLEDVTEGSIRFADDDVTDLRARERDVAMVFQNYALYPHMTVRKNIAFPLLLSTKRTQSEIDEAVRETAELLGIEPLLGQKPGELSGGQRQRVALGRAIVRDPEVFLMDEPLSNLDAKLRADMRTELQELQTDLGVTTVYVTHDQVEAMAMGDRIAVMDDGELQQVGVPEEVYRAPANAFVAGFIGSPSINLATAEVDGPTLEVTGEDGDPVFTYALENPAPVDGHDTARVGIRPEDIRIGDGTNEAVVSVVEPMGNENYCYMSAGDWEMTARVPSGVRPSAGERVAFGFDEAALYLFDADSDDALKTKPATEAGDSQASVPHEGSE